MPTEQTLEEVLEKHLLEAYKREMDQDESVWRTLPFFAAALALSTALIGQGALALPRLDLGQLDAWIIMRYILLALSAMTLLRAAAHLYRAMHMRHFRQIPREDQTLQYLRSLRSEAINRPEDIAKADADAIIIARRYLNDEMAAATAHNRANNESRVRFRSLAVRWFFLSWLFAAALAAVSFIVSKSVQMAPPTESPDGQATTSTAPDATEFATEFAPAEHAGEGGRTP